MSDLVFPLPLLSRRSFLAHAGGSFAAYVCKRSR